MATTKLLIHLMRMNTPSLIGKIYEKSDCQHEILKSLEDMIDEYVIRWKDSYDMEDEMIWAKEINITMLTRLHASPIGYENILTKDLLSFFSKYESQLNVKA